jgi:glucokinase
MIGAVDIGGTKIAVGMVDDHGRVLARVESPTDAATGFSPAIDRISEMLRQCSREASAEITGIGIGCTGPVDPFAGTIGDVPFLPGWQGGNIVGDLSRAFSVRVAMENDADAAALAEAEWGAGKNKTRLMYVTVGTGIGGGFILDGQLYRGVDQSHPEIGHHLLDLSGPPCSCGFHGCWESLAAGPAMVDWVQKNAPPAYPHRENLTAKRICELSVQGDEVSRRAVERETLYLGLGVANLITLFTPDSIVLSGSVMKSASLFLDGIRRIVRQSCAFVPFEKTELALASLGDDTNLIGAARVWHHRFTSGELRA